MISDRTEHGNALHSGRLKKDALTADVITSEVMTSAESTTENAMPAQFRERAPNPGEHRQDHSPALSLSARIRKDTARLLIEGKCTYRHVASALGLHPRTLQRRLRKEGESFESIKDSVRRDVALRHLQQPNVPLMRVAEILGYSEASVLSRSCHRWFAASPRKLRKRWTFG
jgi:AraC-like DNA-binding protein